MATIPQQLIQAVEAAHKAGAESGKEVEEHLRKAKSKLVDTHKSHVYMAHKMLKNSKQFAPALEAIRKGAQGSLSQIAKPYQKAVVPRGAERPAPSKPERKSNGLDKELADALGLNDDAKDKPARRRKFIPPTINPKVFDDFADAMSKKAKGGK